MTEPPEPSGSTPASGEPQGPPSWTPPGGYAAPGTPPPGYGPPGTPPPGYGPPGTPPPGYGPYAAPAAPTSTKAVWSLGLGLASICALGPLGGIPAIVLGLGARREVARSEGRVGGAGMALGGIISGIVGTLLWVVFVFLVVGLFALGREASTSYEDACEEFMNSDGTIVDCGVG